MQDDSQDCASKSIKNPEDLLHQKRDINRIRNRSKFEGTPKDNNSAQDGDKQPNGCGIRQLCNELEIAKEETTAEPLQTCNSFGTSNTTSNGQYPSHPEANMKDNTISSVGNCLQICRTDHDCSEADPEVMDVPELQSVRIHLNAATGASRCYQAVRLAFLQCLEDTPFMVPGLVLTILFCVTIIVVIAATGRVSQGAIEINYTIQYFILYLSHCIHLFVFSPFLQKICNNPLFKGSVHKAT